MPINLTKISFLALFLVVAATSSGQIHRSKEKKEVWAMIGKVNGYWQQNHPAEQRPFWDEAAYQTGNMAAYQLTRNPRYKQYAEDWANYNHWQGATSTDKKNWKYHYGETQDHVLFGDWQICFQTYIDLYALDTVKEAYKIARAREVMEYEMSTPHTDYWWWVDGLYMVMPVMTKLYKATADIRYPEKLYTYWQYTNSILYDSTARLYYRDAKYVFPAHTTVNGKKDFWSRGNGWAFAALAKVLTDLPPDDAHREEYLKIYKDIASAIVPLQQPEGYWSRSLMDAAMAPGPETSGTAFFTYGLCWGLRHKILDPETYLPVAIKAWKYLATFAVQPDGRVGYVQPIGERAIPGQVVDKNSTANFGVGAVLLAATEYYKYLNKQ